MTDQIRTFATGATRTSEEGKNDYEGFLSPLVIERFGDYMTKHRKQADGALRPSDNWQKGIPLDSYAKSMWRHFLEFWKAHRGYPVKEDIEGSLAALLFNVQGYLHEYLKTKGQVYPHFNAAVHVHSPGAMIPDPGTPIHDEKGNIIAWLTP